VAQLLFYSSWTAAHFPSSGLLRLHHYAIRLWTSCRICRKSVSCTSYLSTVPSDRPYRWQEDYLIGRAGHTRPMQRQFYGVSPLRLGKDEVEGTSRMLASVSARKLPDRPPSPSPRPPSPAMIFSSRSLLISYFSFHNTTTRHKRSRILPRSLALLPPSLFRFSSSVVVSPSCDRHFPAAASLA
jgi:hypothetical protein